ncbi:hypothetical protein V865_004930 [Kwoniella europaea PYCC6329]|uniref:Folliculin-interacting protein N-terminal domain-containing protein n=1 Tax=Kwoniella europaea PYCC6329 TaxID=1423913 RepID=A0AAX4KLF5_9TREE
MPSAISLSTSIIPDFKEIRSRSFSLPKSPKAAKRFFGKSEDSPPVPPLPSSSTNSTTPHHKHTPASSSISSTASVSVGFSGATVVRTPQEALEGIKSLTPPVLPQLPIANAYTNTNPNGRKPPIYLHTHTNSLDRGRSNQMNGAVQSNNGNIPKIHRSQSATEELRSPISTTSTSNPATPVTAPPCRGGIVGVKGVLKSPSYGYLRNHDVSADKWAREVLGSIRTSTDNHNDVDVLGLRGRVDMDLGEGEELNSYIDSYDRNTKHDSTQSSVGLLLVPQSASANSTTSLTSIQTFGHDDRFRGYQPSIVSTAASTTQGYTEDQYKPYVHPGSSTTNNSMLMLDEDRYPPRSTSTLQHLEEVKFPSSSTPLPPPSESIISTTTKEEQEEKYDDIDYDPFKKIDTYTSRPIRTTTSTASSRFSRPSSSITIKEQSEVQDKSMHAPVPVPVPFMTPTYPKADPVESTYSPRSKPQQLPSEKEKQDVEDKQFLLALPTRDFTRSPSTHSMHPPSPLSTSPRTNSKFQGHVRSPSTPISSSSPQKTIIQTHTRSPSSPAEFTPSPLSPSPNAPIQKLRRPSLLSNRSTVRPLPPASRTSTRLSVLQTSFHATILEDTSRPLPSGQSDLVLLNLEFAYSLDDKPNNEKVILPIEVVRQYGSNRLVDWLDRYLNRSENGNDKKVISTVTTIPEMTDGESAEESDLESDNGLTALLRDEYLNSFLLPDPPSTATSITTPNPIPVPSAVEGISMPSSTTKVKSPSLPNIPLPPTPASTLDVLDEIPTQLSYGEAPEPAPKKEGWKRGVTPKQYEQLHNIYPTPLAPTSHDGDDDDQTSKSPSEMETELKEREIDMELDDKFNWMPPKTPPLSIKRHARSHLPLTPTVTSRSIDQKEDPGQAQGQSNLRELKIFLTREAGAWHRIAHRLLSGKWGDMRDEIYKQRVIDELDWVGMTSLREELFNNLTMSFGGNENLSSPPVSIGGILSNRIANSPSPSIAQIPQTSMSAGFIGFTPLSGNSSRSSSSTSLMLLRNKGNRVSGVSRGGSGYI